MKILEYTYSGSGQVYPAFNYGYNFTLHTGDAGNGTTIAMIEAESYPTQMMFLDCAELLTVTYIDAGPITSLRNLFQNCTNLQSVSFNGLNTSNLRDISYMFYGCTGIKEVDFTQYPNFDTSKIETMDFMFYDCTNIESINMGNFTCPNLTNMNYCFKDCRNLKELNLSKFISGNLTEMTYVFDNCKMLESLDLSDFDTTNIQSLSFTFNGCNSLKNLVIPKFNTSNAIYLNNTFNGCKSLEQLDISSFRTHNAISLSYLFGSCNSLKSIDLSNIYTTNVEDFSGMFYGCSSLTELDVSRFNTSKATNMQYMFSGCKGLRTLNVSNFDTRKVEYLAYMFSSCTGLVEIDISSISTESAVSLAGMFSTCTGLRSIDVSRFDTRNVNNFNSLFYNCTSLAAIDVSNFDTSNALSMSYMFGVCPNLIELDLSNFRTPYVNTMASMFTSCTNLESLDISNFETSEVTTMASMFASCAKLKELDLGHFDTSKVKNFSFMFSSCSELESLNISGFNTESATNIKLMFSACSKLKEIDVSNFNTSLVTEMEMIFNSCESVEELDLSNWDTSGVISMASLFNGCQKLRVADVSNFDTTMVSTMNSMFGNCRSLLEIDVSKFKTGLVTDMAYMFMNCNAVSVLDVSNFDTTLVNSYANMFEGCRSVKELDLSTFNLQHVSSIGNMLTGCVALQNLDLSNFRVGHISDGPDFFSLKDLSSLDNLGLLYVDTESLNRISETLPERVPPRNVFYLDAVKEEIVPLEKCNFVYYGDVIDRINVPNNTYLCTEEDELDFKTGHIKNVTSYKKFTGSENENWIIDSSSAVTGFTDFTIELPDVDFNYDIFYDINLEKLDLTEQKELINLDNKLIIRKAGDLTVAEFTAYLSQHPFSIVYYLKESIEQDMILGHNGACDYGVRVGNGVVDTYVIKDELYTQNVTYVEVAGEKVWLEMMDMGTTLRFKADAGILSSEDLNIKPLAGLYCDNDIFPNIQDDSDVEHCRSDEQEGVIYIFINKERLLSPDLIGWQVWLQENPFKLWYEMKQNKKYSKAYSDLEYEQAYWGMLKSYQLSTVSFVTEEDILVPPIFNYVVKSANNYIIPNLEPGELYTVYANGVEDGMEINFGGTEKVFESGMTINSAGGDTVIFENSENVTDIIILKGDTSELSIPYFTGMVFVNTPKLTITDGERENGMSIMIPLRGLPDGTYDAYDTLSGVFTKRIEIRDFMEGDFENKSVLTDGSKTLYRLSNAIERTIEAFDIRSYNTTMIELDSESGILPSLHYSVQSPNSFYLPSMKEGTRYTLKYPSASGSIRIGDMKYNLTGDSLVFMTPLTINGDKNAIIFSDEDPQQVVLLEGDYGENEVEFFSGIKTLTNPVITIVDNISGGTKEYKCADDVQIYSLPNGIRDKIDVVNKKLIRAVGQRAYKESDSELANIWTDGYTTIYALANISESAINFETPIITEDCNIEPSSDELMIPVVKYRLHSPNTYPLDLLTGFSTYTLYADREFDGNYTLGGTYSGLFTGTETVTINGITDNYLLFEGDLGLSNVMVIPGNSASLNVDYFTGIEYVQDATFKVTGPKDEEENNLIVDEGLTLTKCNSLRDKLDLNQLKLYKYTEGIRLKGTESWKLHTTERLSLGYVAFSLAVPNIKNSKKDPLLTDRFAHTNLSGKTQNVETVYSNDNQLVVSIKIETINGDSVNAFKRWLKQNNICVIYSLLKSQTISLENTWDEVPPMSYRTKTIIETTVSGKAFPTLNVTVGTTTLEEIIEELQARNNELEEENLMTMMAISSIYESLMVNTASVGEASTFSLRRRVTSASPIAQIYYKLYTKGIKSFEEIPENLRPEVQYLINLNA